MLVWGKLFRCEAQGFTSDFDCLVVLAQTRIYRSQVIECPVVLRVACDDLLVVFGSLIQITGHRQPLIGSHGQLVPFRDIGICDRPLGMAMVRIQHERDQPRQQYDDGRDDYGDLAAVRTGSSIRNVFFGR